MAPSFPLPRTDVRLIPHLKPQLQRRRVRTKVEIVLPHVHELWIGPYGVQVKALSAPLVPGEVAELRVGLAVGSPVDVAVERDVEAGPAAGYGVALVPVDDVALECEAAVVLRARALDLVGLPERDD